MSIKRNLCMGGSIIASVLAISGVAYAQGPVPTPETVSVEEEAAVDEIIVTATRRSENVQDVPMNVTPITGATLAKYNILNFEDVETLTPGLSIGVTSEGSPVVQLRGVSFSTFTSASPAVDLYLNEVPTDASQVFTSLFDIGQIEVLRGPQGTLRGRPAPVGAVTITTRRPDMDEYGVYGAATGSDGGARNLEAGVNIPVIEDVLAVRLSGVYDEYSTGIKNALTLDESQRKTTGLRGTAAWRPTENLEFVLTHQHLQQEGREYVQLEGSGPGGPVLTAADRMGVQEFPNTPNKSQNLTWLNASWDVIGHRLSYIGAHHEFQSNAGTEDRDLGNLEPGTAAYFPFNSDYVHKNHELRFETTGPDRLIDYTVGLYYSDLDLVTDLPSEGFQLPIRTVQKAGFGNATLHLGKTDISAGARYSNYERTDTNVLCLFGFGCAPGQTPANPVQSSESSGWTYNATITHDFTDNLMVYGNYGRSRRPGAPSTFVFTVVPGTPATLTCSFLACGAPVEVADTYELGLKSTWNDGKVRLNAAIFHQDYDNYIGRVNDVPHTALLEGGDVGLQDMNAYGPAKVDGIEADLFIRVTDDLDLQFTAQTADGRYENAFIPCTDGNFDGIADNVVNFNPLDYPVEGVAGCNYSGHISQIPNWSMTIQSEYRHALWDNEGYIRALVNYEPENDKIKLDNSFVRDSRTIVNLYVGLRSRGSWDANLWVKNLLDEQTVLDRGDANERSQIGGLDSGYRKVFTERPREIGVSLRRSFGAG